MKIDKSNIVKDLFKILGMLTFGAGVAVYALGIEITPAFFIKNMPLFIVFVGFCLLLYGLYGGVGKENAKVLEKVKESQQKYDDTRKKIPMGDIEYLDKYCRSWTIKDLETKRYMILASASLASECEGFDASKYTRLFAIKAFFKSFLGNIGDRKFRRDQVRALRRAAKAKPQILTAGMLLACSDDYDSNDMTHPNVLRRKQAIKDFIPILFSAIVGLGISDIALNGFTAEKIITLLYVVYAFSVASIKGYLSGNKAIAVNLVNYQKKQIDRIEEYLASDFCPCKDHETKQTSD